jgi:hypothetical protein
MSRWHNILGENGQRLTILSVLPRVAPDLESQVELSLREAIDELFRIAGEDGHARVVLDVRVHGDDEPQLTTEENLSLRELADRLYRSFGPDGDSVAVLRTLGPGDDPSHRSRRTSRPTTRTGQAARWSGCAGYERPCTTCSVAQPRKSRRPPS